MSKFTFAMRTAAIGVLGLAALLGTSGCENILSPCGSSDKGFNRKNEFMEGTWSLFSIDGVTYNGAYKLPDGATLTKAEMDFHTEKVEEGSCKKPKKTRGEVIALYRLTSKQGVPLKAKTQVGSFTYVNATNALTLSALGKSGNGVATLDADIVGLLDNSYLQVPVKIPLGNEGFSLGNITYQIIFHRTKVD